MMHLSDYVLRLAERQPNPGDVDDTVIEMIDAPSGKVLWRGTIAQLHGFMHGDAAAWNDHDLQQVRGMVQDRRIKGLYVNGDTILRRANNPELSAQAKSLLDRMKRSGRAFDYRKIPDAMRELVDAGLVESVPWHGGETRFELADPRANNPDTDRASVLADRLSQGL